MATQVYGSPFSPVGSAEYLGAGAVVTPTTVPTNSGGFGQTITQVEAALNALRPSGDLRNRIVRSLAFSIEGGTAHILTTGNVPTAVIGVAYGPGVYEWEDDSVRIHQLQAFLPAGVVLNMEYGQ